ncbi:hypothetical protein [Pseudomonas ficuserectae]|uniref:hypothetical protein n=1 Tax=Pseudomonas ficuserectae TaxID=53410 RepID=UPI0011C36FEF|nr:hypothetical protein [Pseudomonas ficuserectae]
MSIDASLERLANIADHLENQAGQCPVSRIKLVTWISDQVGDLEGLEKAERDLPQLPSKLRMDYMAWIHSVGKHAQGD